VTASRIRTGLRRSGRLEKINRECEGCANVLVTLKATADRGSESGSRLRYYGNGGGRTNGLET